MNITHLKNAIGETLQRISPEVQTGPAYLGWTQFLPTDQLGHLEPLTEALRLEEDLALFDGKMRQPGYGAARVDLSSLAGWIVARTLEVGPVQGIADVHRYVTESEFDCLKIMRLSGPAVGSKVDLGGGLELVPPGNLPESTRALTEW